jgi:hypothetical protein
MGVTKMCVAKKLTGCLFIFLFSSQSWGLVSNDTLDEGLYNNLDNKKITKITHFADSVFECGVYYQYTAGGLKNNPKISRDMVYSVSENAEKLREVADFLYQTVGISIHEKYETIMQQAKTLIRERANSEGGISDLIYDRGEKCRLLMVSYPSKLMEITESLGLN